MTVRWSLCQTKWGITCRHRFLPGWTLHWW